VVFDSRKNMTPRERAVIEAVDQETLGMSWEEHLAKSRRTMALGVVLLIVTIALGVAGDRVADRIEARAAAEAVEK